MKWNIGFIFRGLFDMTLSDRPLAYHEQSEMAAPSLKWTFVLGILRLRR